MLDRRIRYPNTYKIMKNQLQQVVAELILPFLCFSAADKELWDEDPEEYIRKGYDVIEDIYSPKTSAVALMCGLCGTF